MDGQLITKSGSCMNQILNDKLKETFFAHFLYNISKRVYDSFYQPYKIFWDTIKMYKEKILS